MCGIVGSLNWQKPDEEALILRMTGAIAHRGPDAEKVKTIGPMVFGHRRLSIIDVSPLSNQPMSDISGRYWIVYNGELYNFKKLKTELEGLGHPFKTHSDTEVILEAYKRFGQDCVDHFVGMFAFAIWDREEQSLFMARDRMGEKPLYYAFNKTLNNNQNDSNIVFASELKALRLHPTVSSKINPKAISQILSLNYVLTDTCILEGVEKLPPAHTLFIKKGKAPVIKCYWQLNDHFHNKVKWSSKEEAIEKLQSLMQESVAGQMIADVPLGAFLSGGIDSSTIVANMKALKDSKSIQTFSIGFHEKSYNEIAESKQVADFLKVDHHTQFIDANMAKILPKIIQATDEPFADSSIIPTYFLAQFSREKVKVCLSGDGGDELFVGYETYAADKLYQYVKHIPKGILKYLSSNVDKYIPMSHNKISFDYKLKQFLKGCLFDFKKAHYSWRTIFSDAEKNTLLDPDILESVTQQDPYASFEKFYQDVEGCHPLDQASYVDMKTWMVDDILVKVDRLSMAHSLEVRAPFLNHHLVEFAASLPIDWKMKGFEKKHILKMSQKKNLPSEILYRPKKGFNAPISPWFAKELQTLGKEATLDNPALHAWCRKDSMEQLWKEQLSGQKDNGLKLFGLMCLGLWLNSTTSENER
jgi:asparagine synthase (glutamine-hydrolysing)